MTRLTVLLLAFALAACDAEAPLTSATDAPPTPVALTSMKSADAPYVITESAAVRASGETVLLRINGETIELRAGEAYMIGEALTRTGYDALSEGLQKQLAPIRPGDRCEPPNPGVAVTAVEGRMYKRCPPPPPPPFLEAGVLDALFNGSVEITEAPEGAEWQRIPGGFVAEY